MYIMVKVEKKLGLLVRGNTTELSILESRKHNRAVVYSNSGGLQSRSTPQRIACAAKQAAVKRGSRKSSSLTNGMSPGTNKTALREYGTEARGLHLSCDFVYAPILGNSADALSIVPRRRH
jgi:hypothetical protein